LALVVQELLQQVQQQACLEDGLRDHDQRRTWAAAAALLPQEEVKQLISVVKEL
jgi:hypothetical protein